MFFPYYTYPLMWVRKQAKVSHADGSWMCIEWKRTADSVPADTLNILTGYFESELLSCHRWCRSSMTAYHSVDACWPGKLFNSTFASFCNFVQVQTLESKLTFELAFGNVQRSNKRVYKVDAAPQTSQQIYKISIPSRVRLISSKSKALA